MSTVVAKIGSSSLTDAAGAIEEAAVDKLAGEVAERHAAGDRVVVVTSGAVAAGVAALGLPERPGDLVSQQALSAVGQSRVMRVWNDALAARGLVGAQVLLTPVDFVNRRQYLKARATLWRLLDLGCVPVLNENDAVADDELRFGDNDRLAALVSHLLPADVLVLLTDTPGLYTADPRTDPAARLVEEVSADDPLLAVDAGGIGTSRGSGGMASKLAAARIASWSGVRAVIAPAARDGVLSAAVDGRAGVGTVFRPNAQHLPARKLWIAFAARPAGAITVDEGARRALVERGRSLLPAGVTGVEGDFDEGDTVELRGPDGRVFARGMVWAAAGLLRSTAGRQTSELPEGMAAEVVHRDDLVVVPG